RGRQAFLFHCRASTLSVLKVLKGSVGLSGLPVLGGVEGLVGMSGMPVLRGLERSAGSTGFRGVATQIYATLFVEIAPDRLSVTLSYYKISPRPHSVSGFVTGVSLIVYVGRRECARCIPNESRCVKLRQS